MLRRSQDTDVPGKDARGVHFAVDYTASVTKSLLDSGFADSKAINAAGKNVLVIGGSDSSDVGHCLRQGCRPDGTGNDAQPLSSAPLQTVAGVARVLKVDYGQTECIAKFGKDPRVYQTTVKEF